MTNDKSQTSNPPILKRAYRFLARVDVAAVLIVVVLLVAALGSCFPQLSPAVAADSGRMAQWEAGVRARYGGMTDGLVTGGVFRWFRSPVFLGPLALLAAATLVCTLDRWRGIWRRAFYQPVRCSDVALDTAPHTARLSTSPAVELAAVAREGLERRGFRVRTTEVVTTDHPLVYLRGDRNRLAPLATLVTHLAVLLLLLGGALSSGYGWREEIAIGPGEMAEVGHGSGLALRNEGFAIERYADGSVAGYEAEVAVFDGHWEVARGSVLVNEPLTYGLVGLVLQGYAEAPGGTSVALLAVRDPGYGPVVAAGFLLLLGLTVSFNFPHCWVHARIDPDGTLRLAGRADRRACDFGPEFTALAGEVRSLVAGEREDTG